MLTIRRIVCFFPHSFEDLLIGTVQDSRDRMSSWQFENTAAPPSLVVLSCLQCTSWRNVVEKRSKSLLLFVVLRKVQHSTVQYSTVQCYIVQSSLQSVIGYVTVTVWESGSLSSHTQFSVVGLLAVLPIENWLATDSRRYGGLWFGGIQLQIIVLYSLLSINACIF